MVLSDRRWEAAADEVARMPGLAEALITAHRPDEHGRCLACTTPGVGTANVRWPCGPYRLGADAARRPSPPMTPAEATDHHSGCSGECQPGARDAQA